VTLENDKKKNTAIIIEVLSQAMKSLIEKFATLYIK
jgi:hypothetical protein